MKRISVIAAVVMALTGAGVFAQQPGHDDHAKGADAPAKPGMGMMGQKCEMMQQKMDAMHGKMMAEQQKLHAILQDMNTATGPAKTEAMAAAINEIAANCEAMHRMEADMMMAMMTHMTEHMAQGGGNQMMMCPMMQGHGDAAAGDHSEHSAPPAPEAPKAPAPTKPAPDDDHSQHHPSQ